MKKSILDTSQSNLLKIIKSWRLWTMDVDLIMSEVGVSYPQAIYNKLKQLENKWFIRKNNNWDYYALREPIDDVYYFPLIWFAQCWNLVNSDITDINHSDTIAFSTKALSLDWTDDLQNYFFTKAKWDSMLPVIKENDLVLIKLQPTSEVSDYTLLVHNGKPKIKRVFVGGDWKYSLISLNPHFPELEVWNKNEDEMEIIWIVRKVISSPS